ncbi:hypothetical protein C9374_000125 [Naegleria lovaniensis]|uniref:Cleavage and polyadenylation specificity factor subunit 2 n=1 Tax=Naegleria lovaniensis TaxID=51637 RepID=A0AA88GZ66_NAELO|nr:uncharacterized protein C9374_000125 [Naegleria lovaniensis]KAG2388686.1 hypothetical protein C9374_000125 [Naegleria lovaniensis]
MSSAIQYISLVGSQNEGPLCSLLIVDDYYILLDCGWDENFNTKDEHIQQIVNVYKDKIDAILISHSDIYHCGALPYLVGKCGILENKKKAKIFATLPIVKMGQMHMYDACQNVKQREDFETFDLDDVDLCFDNIIQLKYSQRYPLSQQMGGMTQIENTNMDLENEGVEGEDGEVGGSTNLVAEMEGEKLVICPFLAGHTLGGTIWKITKETDEIVYAVDFNIKKERHLNGSVLGELGGKPSLLITDAYNIKPIPSTEVTLVPKSSSSKETVPMRRDKQIVTSVVEALKRDGNVLMPVETAGRVLELMLILEEEWKRKPDQLGNFELILLTNVAYRTIDFAAHQLEWMSDSIMKGFDEKRENPFSFKYFSVCHNVEELMTKLKQNEAMRRMMEGIDDDDDDATQKKQYPIVVLASSSTLDVGFARELFVKWCEDQRNMVLFTDRSSPNSFARKLINKIRAKKTNRLDEVMKLVMSRRVPLKGEELERYEKEQLIKQEAEKKRREEEERKKRVIQIRDEDDEDIADKKSKKFREEFTGSGFDDDSHTQTHLYLPENMRYQSQYLMFPCIERGISKDEYGESVDPEEFETRLLQADQKDQLMSTSANLHEEEENYEPPSKIESEEVSVRILCKLAYIDFEGRSSNVDIKNILQKINPRKLIIIHGMPEALTELKEYCETKKIAEQIKAPVDLETLDMTMDTNMFKVKLKQDLLSHVHFVKSGTNYDMAYIEGIFKGSENAEDPLPSIYPNPKPKGHPTILIGDVKLNQLYRLLLEKGLSAEFQQGGVLVCNDEVMLQKDKKSGEIQIVGSLSPTFFQVRELLYSFYKEL